METKAVIIEDEIAARERLVRMLRQHFPEVEIVATPDSVPDAVSAIRRHLPQLVFADIEIKLGSGFDVLTQVKDIPFDVIFITAFDAYAIDAFRHHAIDYLLKPLKKELLIESVERYLARREQAQPQSASLILSRLPELFQPPRISIATQEGLDFVDPREILYAEASGSYTKLTLKNGNRLLVSKRLREIEEKLPSALFSRVHHSYIVNLSCITKYLKGRGGNLVLINGEMLPVSVGRKDEFLKRIE